jgi:hypothetical protein
MSDKSCPHCGAKPFNPVKQEGIQARCEVCNGLIVSQENKDDQIQTACDKDTCSCNRNEGQS